MSAGYVSAGTLSRGAGSTLLSTGIHPRLMPLAIGLVACPIACGLIVVVDRAPGPSAADIAERAPRSAMSGRQQLRFVRQHFAGLACVLLAYSGFVGVRSFRDFYSQQVHHGTSKLAQPTASRLSTAGVPWFDLI
jgi:hypothetical protein